MLGWLSQRFCPAGDVRRAPQSSLGGREIALWLRKSQLIDIIGI